MKALRPRRDRASLSSAALMMGRLRRAQAKRRVKTRPDRTQGGQRKNGHMCTRRGGSRAERPRSSQQIALVPRRHVPEREFPFRAYLRGGIPAESAFRLPHLFPFFFISPMSCAVLRPAKSTQHCPRCTSPQPIERTNQEPHMCNLNACSSAMLKGTVEINALSLLYCPLIFRYL